MNQTAESPPGRLSHRRGMGLVQTVTSVGAVVALTTAVVVPGLIGLRDRNRQAICTARIGLLTRAMLCYAADYDETPPFMGLGWEDIHYPDKPSDDPSSTAGGPGDVPTKTRWGWAVAETWVTQHPELLWNGTLPEDDWAANGVGVTTGLLFPYARFETVYRCPEFERAPDKVQGAFNYTRTTLGRKWLAGGSMSGTPDPDYWGAGSFGAPGLILRTSEIHRPSLLPMLYDESWRRHVAAAYDQHAPPRDPPISGGWMAVDCVNFYLGDEIGRYHGRPARAEWITPAADPVRVKRGNIACYDGHVELTRDVWPDRSDMTSGALCVALSDLHRWLSFLMHAQRGPVGSTP